ncbi:C40 family peptidase [Gimibacter soli]|uniref:C40 family peptidase n=1 Tax=Gimibacter soli TaxID=3024400 RepID=A0AAF0BLN6_9PROT|nr:C40 family peptidase [Gimibacter soli]WCL54377.1 C40 family peptidase [Gimibacter soli]
MNRADLWTIDRFPPLLDPKERVKTDNRLDPAVSVDAHCRLPWAALKATPDDGARAVSEILYGEPVAILDQAGGWVKVVNLMDAYVGWAQASGFERIGGLVASHRVTAGITHLYSDPDLKAEPVMPLPMGALVSLADDVPRQRFLPLSHGGWIFSGHVASLCAVPALDFTTIAERFIGTPYLWGGRTFMGLDCSGLVQLAMAAVGKRVHRDSDLQRESIGTPLADGEAPSRGDLAFFPGHVGVMVDETRMIHANATHMAVTINRVSEVADWLTAEGKNPAFLGYRRP